MPRQRRNARPSQLPPSGDLWASSSSANIPQQFFWRSAEIPVTAQGISFQSVASLASDPGPGPEPGPEPIRVSRRSFTVAGLTGGIRSLERTIHASRGALANANESLTRDNIPGLNRHIEIMQDFLLAMRERRAELEQEQQNRERLGAVSAINPYSEDSVRLRQNLAPGQPRRRVQEAMEFAFNGQKVSVYLSPVEGARIGLVVSTPRGSYAKRIISLIVNSSTGKLQFYREAIPLRESPEHGLSLMMRDASHLVISERKE